MPILQFELFRRAIKDRNERAWELVYHQYRPLTPVPWSPEPCIARRKTIQWLA
jgi:hypothetical protein